MSTCIIFVGSCQIFVIWLSQCDILKVIRYFSVALYFQTQQYISKTSLSKSHINYHYKYMQDFINNENM